MVRSPVDICLGTRPSQAAKSRPLENASPAPIAAIIELEMIGPMPRTLISCLQLESGRAMASISLDKPSMRSSSRCQSPVRSSMMRTMRGEPAADWQLRRRCPSDAVAANKFRASDAHDAQLRRHPVQHLVDGLADRMQRAATARAAFAIDVENNLLAWQMFGQRPAFRLRIRR